MHYASFLVRIWLPDVESSSVESALRGQIEHVQSMATAHLTNLEDVLAFIQKIVFENDPKDEDTREST
jgi:hypothetical protein